ncbi:hypothetical protein [Winogradskyella alexanderae]|uniref:Lipocalin-like domain-containing protein n=1 Tax=Winogradskyella alexanderae TaxID=2877123 RepID=A0ABS7XQK0_9FLAO|nr:hypothetical protein [Winogradskyella alexanderae]MCA0131242.1 hypothetical protein [Winogradskyella alexanderae]
MKKIATFCCLFVLLFSFNCDNEPVDFDISALSFNPRILGEWHLVEFNAEVSYLPSAEDQSPSTEMRVFSTASNYTLTFDDDNFRVRGDYTYNARLRVNGIEQTSNFYTNADVDSTYGYSVNSEEVVFEQSLFNITAEEENTIYLLGEQISSFIVSENGETLIVRQDETLTNSNTSISDGATIIKKTSSIWTKDFALFNCTLREATREAEIAYNQSNQDIQSCLNYRRALEDQILECGDPDGSLAAIINQLGNCGLLSADVLRVTAGLQNIDFANKTISYSNEIISVYGAALFGNHSISFEVPENVTGIDTFLEFVIKVDGTEYFPYYPGVNNFRFNTLISNNFSFNAVFEGTVISAQGEELTLSVGIVDVNY